MLPRNYVMLPEGLCYAVVMALPLFCTWLPHNWTVYIADVECTVFDCDSSLFHV